ncbi:MAG: site-specific integrase [Akkermansia sp.]|nr:site-specific integrase [Akkermansia sp.]
MARVTYSKKTRTFTALWKDYAKEVLGERYPYGRKSSKWQGERAPTACEKREVIRSMLKDARKAETASMDRAELIRIYGKQEAIAAEGYLKNLKDEELCISTAEVARKAARQEVNTFVEWLHETHEGIALHRIKSTVASQFYKYLQTRGLAYGTIQHYIARLRYVFNEAMLKQEESAYKPSNPFATLRLHKVIAKVAGHRRRPYTQEQLRMFLAAAADTRYLNKWKVLQRFACYYFIIVTGWRVNDILGLCWQQVDLGQELIRLKHSKTRNQGIRTELRITELMKLILRALQKLQDTAEEKRKGYLFPLWGGHAGTSYANLTQHFAKLREKWQLTEYEKQGVHKTHTYTIHSFRGTVITRLTQAGFQEARINYLVGHSPSNTETKHYLTLGADDIKELVEHMEKLCGAAAIADEVELIRQTKEPPGRE